MKSFFQYQGSKRREIPMIEKYMPKKWDTFVDVFGGGGSVILSQLNENYKSKTFHYNDKNELVFNVFNKFTNLKEAKKFNKELSNIKITKKNSELAMNDKLKISEEALFLYKGAVAYRGMRNSKLYDIRKKFKNKTMEERFKPIEHAKQVNEFNFLTTNCDYKDIFNQCKDDKNAFLYLDPPYVGKKYDEYDIVFTIDDIYYIKEFMESCKCKVMLNIDYWGFTRETFSDMFKIGYPIKYNLKNGSGRLLKIYKNYHLIATNYKK